jgi:hypothetical protein
MSPENDSIFQNLMGFLVDRKYQQVHRIKKLRTYIEQLESNLIPEKQSRLFVFGCEKNVCALPAKDRENAHELRLTKCKFKSMGNRFAEYINSNCTCYDVETDFADSLEGKKIFLVSM